MTTALRGTDLRLLATLFSPERIVPRAEEYGFGCAVSGAKAAFYESRVEARAYLRFAIERAELRGASEKDMDCDRKFAFHAFRIAEKVQPLAKMDSDFRAVMVDAWPERTPWPIYGEVPVIDVGAASQEDIRLAVFKATSEMLLARPTLNRAVLPPYSSKRAVWRRSTAEIVVPVRFSEDDMALVVLDLAGKSRKEARRDFKERLRGMLQVRRHAEIDVGRRLMSSWMRHGFIVSYGGAIVSDCGRYRRAGTGHPIFIAPTGVPITVAINPARERELRLTVALDHRAFDIDHGEMIHAWYRERVPAYLEGDWRHGEGKEGTDNGRVEGDGPGHRTKVPVGRSQGDDAPARAGGRPQHPVDKARPDVAVRADP